MTLSENHDMRSHETVNQWTCSARKQIGNIPYSPAHQDAQAQLRFQAQLLSSVQESVVATDLQGQVIFWGPGAEKLYGWSAEEAIGKHVTLLINPENQAAELLRMQTVRNTGFWCGQYQQKRKDGTIFWADTHISLIRDEQGHPCGYVGIDRDITCQKEAEAHRRRLENQLHEAQKMEAVGRLADGVAHDISNLLSAISGYLDTARKTLPPDHPVLSVLGGVEEAADHALGVIRSLLTFSQQTPIEMKPIDMVALLEEMIVSLQRLFPPSIEIILDFCSSDPIRILGDATRLKHALLNLAFNARDAMPQGGRIIFKLERCAPAQLRLSIIDTGPGIAADIAPHIFEPYFTTKSKGNGLGLSLVYGIVSEHGGRVEFAPQRKDGAEFHIELPVLLDRADSALAENTPRPASHVFLHVPNEYQRSIMARALQQAHMNILPSEGNRDPLDIFSVITPRPDLAVIDPDPLQIDPPRWIEQCCASAAGIPVILLTARPEQFGAEPCENILLLQKPYQIHELTELAARMLGPTVSTTKREETRWPFH